jgi:hypothetical protein
MNASATPTRMNVKMTGTRKNALSHDEARGIVLSVVNGGSACERKPHPDRSTYAARTGHDPEHIWPTLIKPGVRVVVVAWHLAPCIVLAIVTAYVVRCPSAFLCAYLVGPASDELWEVLRSSPSMQHLLDDLDNFGWWRRFTYIGDLSELTFRYGVVTMNHKRNITFAEQSKEVHSARLPGITVYDNR